jgi:hypothetical protein
MFGHEPDNISHLRLFMATLTFTIPEPERIPILEHMEQQKTDEQAALDKKNTLQIEMRACWKRGEGWQVEFGLLLIQFRNVTEHGEWIKFLETEFDLHRQTAWNWMRKAAEVHCVTLDDRIENRVDEPDNLPEEVADGLQEHQDKLDELEENGSKIVLISLLKLDVTEDEKERYKAVLKSERDWVRVILRDAFDKILEGKPVIRTGKMVAIMPDDCVENPVYFDQPEMPLVSTKEPEIMSGDRPISEHLTIGENGLPEKFFEHPEDLDDDNELHDFDGSVVHAGWAEAHNKSEGVN